MTLTLLGIASLVFVAAFTTVVALRKAASVGQSPRESLVEAWANVGVGFGVNYCANLVLLPLIGIRPGLLDNFWLGCIYTVISVARQYALRRVFNHLTNRKGAP